MTITKPAFQLQKGNVSPFGASLNKQGCNFSIYCPDASKVYLCLFDSNEVEIAQMELQQRLQSKWYGFVSGVEAGQLYGYRIESKAHRKVNDEMDVGRLLIDPYAKQINRPLHWQRDAYQGEERELLGQNVFDNAAFIPKSVVTPCSDLPETVYCKLHRDNSTVNNRVIYEAHVKGLSKLHPDVPEEHRGTYLGACHPAVIGHLKDLGVTSVQFLPLFAFMPEPYITEKGLSNYWGYNPINFFSPEPRYAHKDALSECKFMVQEYHKAGIEVILDVVFNHTAESGEPGAILSFKGLCHQHAYLQVMNDEVNTPTYLNYSGCGNTINAANAFMMTMIIDALRYWVSEIGVDGFRFDLAASLGREPFDFHANAAIFKILRQDPILKGVTMIAEPWDIGPGGYQLGQFPDYWLEVNDKFRDSVRGFWRSDTGLKADFATRLMGSRDVFRKGIRPMQASVNNITYHDGFTLQDIVMYEQKHNLANLEDNHDGHNHNLSCNFGVEGPSDEPEILYQREQQKRNLFATLILSQGTPHILGGDELSRSQKGNNNAYCQDNELNWLDWSLDERQKEFLAFTRHVISLRKDNPLLARMMFDDDQFSNEVNVASAEWYRVDGSHKRDQDWTNDNHHCFALHIIEAVDESEQETDREAQEWLYCINSSPEDVEFNLPLLLSSEHWECVLNTHVTRISDYQAIPVSPLFSMPARCFCLFRKNV